MSKITALPAAGALTGDETVVLVQAGNTRRGQIGPLVEAAIAPQIEAANEAAATAVDVAGQVAADRLITQQQAALATGASNAVLAGLGGFAPGAVLPILAASAALLAAVTAPGGGVPVAGTEAFLSDGNRFGLFRFTAGNQSVNVAADTNQAIWIAPAAAATGINGAWQRVMDNRFADVRWWGAIPNDTAAADNNRLRMTAAASWCANNGKTLWIPIGEFFVTANNAGNTGVDFIAPIGGHLSVVGECRYRAKITRAPIAAGTYPAGSSAVVWLHGNENASYSIVNLHFDGNEQNHPLTNRTVAGNYFSFACDGATRSFAIPNSSLGFLYLTSGGTKRCLRPHEYTINGSGAGRVAVLTFFPANGDTVEWENAWAYEQNATIRHKTGTGNGIMRGVYASFVTFSNRVGDSYMAATQSDTQHWSDIESLVDRGFRPRSDIQLSRLPLSFKLTTFTLNGFEMEPAVVRANVALSLANGTIRGPWDMAGDVAAGSTAYCTIDAVNVKCLALPTAHPLVYSNFYNMRGITTGCYFGALERIQRPRGLMLVDCQFSPDSLGLMRTVANAIELTLDADDTEVTLIRPVFKVDLDLYPQQKAGAHLEALSAHSTSALRRRATIIDPQADGVLPRIFTLNRQMDVRMRVGRGLRAVQYAIDASNSAGSQMKLAVQVESGFDCAALLYLGTSTPSATTLGDMTVELSGQIDAKKSAVYLNYGTAGWTVSGIEPIAGATITLNGHVITFVDTVPVGQQVLRMGDGQKTAQMLIDYINNTPACGLYASLNNTAIALRARTADGAVAMAQANTGWAVPAALSNANPVDYNPGATAIDWRGRLDFIVDADPTNTHRGVPGVVARRAMPETGAVNEWHFRQTNANRSRFGSKTAWAAAAAF